jgi:hypothetical protein
LELAKGKVEGDVSTIVGFLRQEMRDIGKSRIPIKYGSPFRTLKFCHYTYCAVVWYSRHNYLYVNAELT